MMPKKRKRISRGLEFRLLYRSARTCAVCRTPRAPVQIHHIDDDPSNNSEGNLIVICQNCHDEAHTKHKLSRNLTPNLLSGYKAEWEEEVETRSKLSMTPGGNLSQAMWTYVNHQRLPDILRNSGVGFDPDWLTYLVKRGVVDQQGIPIFRERGASGGALVTIYDHFNWDDSQRLHGLYTQAVDSLILATYPLELGAIWTKSEIRKLVRPGSLCFCMRGFHFKRGPVVRDEEDRLVFARSKNIEVRFLANTRHMYGFSALYDSFTGHRFAAVLLVVKDLSKEGKNLVIRGTPLAMGAGFVPRAYCTPHPLRYGWARFDGQTDEMLKGEAPGDFLDNW